MRPVPSPAALIPRLVLGLGALAIVAALAPAPARAQQPSVKFPGGDAQPVPGQPGQFAVLPGGTIRWTVVFNGMGLPSNVTLDYRDLMGASGMMTCGPQMPNFCEGAEFLQLLCPAPPDADAVDPGTGVVAVCDEATDELLITGINVAIGAVECIEFSTMVDPAVVGSGLLQIGNQGCVNVTFPLPQPSVTSPTTDGTPQCNPPPTPGIMQCSLVNILEPMFEVEAIKTGTLNDSDGDGEPDIGETIVWSVDVTNTGAEDADIFVFDDIPAGTSFVDFVDGDGDGMLDDLGGLCSFRPGPPTDQVACDMLTLGSGATVTMTFETQVECTVLTDMDTGDICNQARICQDMTGLQCVPSDNDGLDPPFEETCIDFPFTNYTNSTKEWTFEDVDGDGTVNTGDRVTFVITVTNDGRADAAGVTVTDQLDSGCMILPPFDDGGGTYDGGTETLTFDVGDIPAGESVVVQFVVEVTEGGGPMCCNQAGVNDAAREACGLLPIPTDDPGTPLTDDDVTCVRFGPQPVVQATKDFVISNDQNGDGMVDNGDELEFTVIITNTGSGTATNVVFDDTLLPCWGNFDETAVDIQPPGSGTNMSTPFIPPTTPARVLVTEVGGPDGLAPGETVVITFRAEFTSIGGGTSCCNQGMVSYDESTVDVLTDDPTTMDPLDTTCSDRSASAVQLSVTKTADEGDPNGCWEPGEDVTYTLTVEVTGGDTTGVILTDLINDPSIVAFLSSPGGVYDPGTNTITWDIGPMSDGDMQVFTWDGQIDCDADDLAPFSDTATVTADDGAPDTDTWMDAVARPILRVQKQESFDDANGNGALDPGEDVTFDITIANLGSCPATNLVVTDQLDPDLDPASVVVGQGGNDGGMGDVSWDSGTTAELAMLSMGDAPVMLSVTAAADDPATNPRPMSDSHVDNTVDVTADNPTYSVCPPASASSVQLDIVSGPSLEVEKVVAEGMPPGADGDGFIEPGEEVIFTITVTARDGNVNNIQLVDQLQAVNVVDVIDPLNGVHDTVNDTITWDLGTLMQDASASEDWIGQVACDAVDGAVFMDTATATSTDGPAGTDFLEGMVQAPVLSVRKVADPNDQVAPGGTVTFTITVENTGSAPADGVTVTDTIDADLDWGSLTIGGGGVSDGMMPPTITWDLGTIGPATLMAVSVMAPALDPMTNPQAGADGCIDNTADVTTTSPDPALCPMGPFVTGSATLDPCVQVGDVGAVTLYRNAFISCRNETVANIETILAVGEPAIMPAGPGTTSVMPGGNTWTFPGDADLAESNPTCPQLAVGTANPNAPGMPVDDHRAVIYYELSTGDTITVSKSGPDVVIDW